MPDVELFGPLRTEDVLRAVSGAPYSSALSIVRNTHVVIGVDRNPQTFLRVYATDNFPPHHLHDLVERLKKVAGVEVAPLHSWHPHE